MPQWVFWRAGWEKNNIWTKSLRRRGADQALTLSGARGEKLEFWFLVNQTYEVQGGRLSSSPVYASTPESHLHLSGISLQPSVRADLPLHPVTTLHHIFMTHLSCLLHYYRLLFPSSSSSSSSSPTTTTSVLSSPRPWSKTWLAKSDGKYAVLGYKRSHFDYCITTLMLFSKHLNCLLFSWFISLCCLLHTGVTGNT